MNQAKNGHISEGMVQKALFDCYVQRGHILITPNAQLWFWEVDLITVIPGSMRIIENEIKVTRSDFKADFKKRKHNFIGRADNYGPNYFRYVVPKGVCKEGELPAYAGLIEFELRDSLFDGQLQLSLREKKRCPILHRQPIDKQTILSLSKKLMWRYWNKSGVPASPEASLHPERFT